MGLFRKNDKKKAKVIEEPEDDFPEEEEGLEDEEEEDMPRKMKKAIVGASKREFEGSEKRPELSETDVLNFMQNVEARLQFIEKHGTFHGVRD